MARQQTGGRLKATLFLFGALLVAGLVSFAVWTTLAKYQEQLEKAQAGPSKVEVLVATRDLYMGIPLEEEDLTVKSVLPETIEQDRVFTPEMQESMVAQGVTPRERILKGEVLRVERMARREAGIGLNAIIPPGKRAMTIETDAQSALAGLLQPGNFVDCIVTIRPDDRAVGAKWVTETILQGVKVLAIGDSLSPTVKAEKDAADKKSGRRRRGRPTVTLELTLEESEKVALAASRGDIHLVLRSDIDITQEETTGPLNTNALIGFEPAAAPATASRGRGRGRSKKAPPPPNTVTAEVIEGGSTTSVEFDESGTKVDESSNNRRRR